MSSSQTIARSEVVASMICAALESKQLNVNHMSAEGSAAMIAAAFKTVYAAVLEAEDAD